MHFPGAGNNVPSYVCMNEAYEVYLTLHTHRTVRSQLSIPPRVDLKVSKRPLLLLGLAVLSNASCLVGMLLPHPGTFLAYSYRLVKHI